MQGISRQHGRDGFEEEDFIEQQPGLAIIAAEHLGGHKRQQGFQRGGGRRAHRVGVLRLLPTELIPNHPLLRIEQRLANQKMGMVHDRPRAVDRRMAGRDEKLNKIFEKLGA